jgi:hypothetical protein
MHPTVGVPDSRGKGYPVAALETCCLHSPPFPIHGPGIEQNKSKTSIRCETEAGEERHALPMPARDKREKVVDWCHQSLECPKREERRLKCHKTMEKEWVRAPSIHVRVQKGLYVSMARETSIYVAGVDSDGWHVPGLCATLRCRPVCPKRKKSKENRSEKKQGGQCHWSIVAALTLQDQLDPVGEAVQKSMAGCRSRAASKESVRLRSPPWQSKGRLAESRGHPRQSTGSAGACLLRGRFPVLCRGPAPVRGREAADGYRLGGRLVH